MLSEGENVGICTYVLIICFTVVTDTHNLESPYSH